MSHPQLFSSTIKSQEETDIVSGDLLKLEYVIATYIARVKTELIMFDCSQRFISTVEVTYLLRA